MSADPIGLAGGDHRFGYAGGDPVQFVDPLGLSALGIAGVSGGSMCMPGMGSACGGGGEGGPPILWSDLRTWKERAAWGRGPIYQQAPNGEESEEQAGDSDGVEDSTDDEGEDGWVRERKTADKDKVHETWLFEEPDSGGGTKCGGADQPACRDAHDAGERFGGIGGDGANPLGDVPVGMGVDLSKDISDGLAQTAKDLASVPLRKAERVLEANVGAAKQNAQLAFAPLAREYDDYKMDRAEYVSKAVANRCVTCSLARGEPARAAGVLSDRARGVVDLLGDGGQGMVDAVDATLQQPGNVSRLVSDDEGQVGAAQREILSDGVRQVGGVVDFMGMAFGVRGLGGRFASKGIPTTTRVGRWMSEREYQKMVYSGFVQESFSGTTHVGSPASAGAFGRQAKPGSLYVEFDVPTSSLKQTQAGWAKVLGPNTIEARLARRLGQSVPEMPEASNIQYVTTKEP